MIDKKEKAKSRASTHKENKYSLFSLAKNAVSKHKNWSQAWQSPELKPEYDIVIIGAGGHGLATAYYLSLIHI